MSPLLSNQKRVKTGKPPASDLIEESKEESEEEDDERMSPRLLIAMLAETTPRPSESQQETKRNFEEQNFTNALFRVEFYQRKQNFSAVVELKLSPPMDANG